MTPRTVAYQAPLSMGFSRQEYWNGLPFPSPGDLPNQGIEPWSPAFRQMLYHMSQQERAIQSPEGRCYQRDALNVSVNMEDPSVATGLEKVNPHPNSQDRQYYGMFKPLDIALISHVSKVMLKILHARLQHYANQELPDVQAGFRNA